MMNYELEQLRKDAESLRQNGYGIQADTQGYKVRYKGEFICAAGTLHRPKGRWAFKNIPEHLRSAVRAAQRHQAVNAEILT